MVNAVLSNFALVLLLMGLVMWILSIAVRLVAGVTALRTMHKSPHSVYVTSIPQLQRIPLRQVLEEHQATARRGQHWLLRSVALPLSYLSSSSSCGEGNGNEAECDRSGGRRLAGAEEGRTQPQPPSRANSFGALRPPQAQLRFRHVALEGGQWKRSGGGSTLRGVHPPYCMPTALCSEAGAEAPVEMTTTVSAISPGGATAAGRRRRQAPLSPSSSSQPPKPTTPTSPSFVISVPSSACAAPPPLQCALLRCSHAMSATHVEVEHIVPSLRGGASPAGPVPSSSSSLLMSPRGTAPTGDRPSVLPCGCAILRGVAEMSPLACTFADASGRAAEGGETIGGSDAFFSPREGSEVQRERDEPTTPLSPTALTSVLSASSSVVAGAAPCGVVSRSSPRGGGPSRMSEVTLSFASEALESLLSSTDTADVGLYLFVESTAAASSAAGGMPFAVSGADIISSAISDMGSVVVESSTAVHRSSSWTLVFRVTVTSAASRRAEDAGAVERDIRTMEEAASASAVAGAAPATELVAREGSGDAQPSAASVSIGSISRVCNTAHQKSTPFCPSTTLLAPVFFRTGPRAYRLRPVFAIGSDDNGVRDDATATSTTGVRSDGGDSDSHRSCCIVCFSSERNVVLLPCGHYCICMACARRMSECPCCRASIQFSVWLLV